MIIIDNNLLEEISEELFSVKSFESFEKFQKALSNISKNLKYSDETSIKKALDSVYAKDVEFEYKNVLNKFLSFEPERNLSFLELFFKEGILDKFLSKYRVKGPIIHNKRSQSAYDISFYIQERIFVETEYDTDFDEYKDLIEVYISRPKETKNGMLVPTILIANPYLMTCNENVYENHLYDVNVEFSDKEITDFLLPQSVNEDIKKREVVPISESNEAVFPVFNAEIEFLDSYRGKGYATLYSPGRGSYNSQGINICGSELETEAVVAVLKWMSGKAKAYTDVNGSQEIICNWSNGNVGMNGKSYLGTLCTAAATTGQENLKTIVPEVAICNWYGYFRYNGVLSCCEGYQGDDIDLLTWYCQSFLLNPKNQNEKKLKIWNETLEKIRNDMARDSGAYNEFWDERNYLNKADKIKCSMLIIHGINDWNVKTNQCYDLWDATNHNNIVRNMLLHRGEHIYIYNLEEYDFADYIHRWFDHWLLEIDNGFKDGKVTIQDNLNPKIWRSYENLNPEYETYFASNSVLTCKKPEEVKETIVFKDSLEAIGYDFEKDNQNEWLSKLILLNNGNSLKYTTVELPENKVINGNIELKLRANVNSESAIISAMLVDLGTDKRLNTEPLEISGKKLSLGINGKSMNLKKIVFQDRETDFKVITRGFAKMENGVLKSGRIPLIPTDYHIKKGHKLMLILYGQDAEYTIRGLKNREITIDEPTIELSVPFLRM